MVQRHAIRRRGQEVPGEDVRIYSTPRAKVGIAAGQGRASGTRRPSICLPYEESYYAAVALIMALDGKPMNGYVNEERAAAR